MHLPHTQAEWDATLVVTCRHAAILEIATGSVMKWIFHMKGAVSIMESHTQLSEKEGLKCDEVFSP